MALTSDTSRKAVQKIEDIKKRYGQKLLILGHHYQRPEIIALSDLLGDSFQLSKWAAADEECEVIAFCGVHFMAETADILANRPEQVAKRGGRRVDVLLPDLNAGCPMADMAALEDVEDFWKRLGTVLDVETEVVPVTYVNSSAAIKAFCGRHGGIACTSSNANAVLTWAFQQKPRVLFLPDQYLGRNTSLKMGVQPEERILIDPVSQWQTDPKQAAAGLRTATGEFYINSEAAFHKASTESVIQKARIFLWNGYCGVHQKFLSDDIDRARQESPGVRVIVHPECHESVVQKADLAGSTGKILSEIEKSPGGAVWAVGTEGRFVGRMAKMFHVYSFHQILKKFFFLQKFFTSSSSFFFLSFHKSCL